MKKILLSLLCASIAFSHPVSYTIDLEVSYDSSLKKANIVCSSNSRNKCGLYSIKLLDQHGKELANKRFPFLKKSVLINTNTKPSKLEFYLRKTPEHKYIKIF